MRPRDEVGKVRKALALDQLADLVAIDKRLKDIGTQIKTVVAETRHQRAPRFAVSARSSRRS